MYLWNTHRLAEALGRQELTAAEKFQHILLFHVIYAAAAYLAWMFVLRTSNGLVFWFEGAIVLVLTVAGLNRCRERYSVAIQDRFIEDCMLLQVPIAIKFYAFFWLAHLATDYFFVWLVPRLNAETLEEAYRIESILKPVISAYPYLYIFLGTALFYIRLSRHIETAARAQHP